MKTNIDNYKYPLNIVKEIFPNHSNIFTKTQKNETIIIEFIGKF